MLPASILGKWFWAEHLHITHIHPHHGIQSTSFFFFFFNFHLLTFLLSWVFAAARTFLWLRRAGATLQLRCADFSLQWRILLQSMGCRCRGSVAVAHGLRSFSPQAPENRLKWALLLCYMWDLPRPGIEPMSPASVGGFFASEPPGKVQSTSFYKIFKIAPTMACRLYHWG